MSQGRAAGDSRQLGLLQSPLRTAQCGSLALCPLHDLKYAYVVGWPYTPVTNT